MSNRRHSPTARCLKPKVRDYSDVTRVVSVPFSPHRFLSAASFHLVLLLYFYCPAVPATRYCSCLAAAQTYCCVLHSVYGLATRDEPARRPIPFTVYRKKEKKRSGCESVASFTYITHVHHMCNKKARLGIYEYSKKKNRRQLEQRFQTFEYST